VDEIHSTQSGETVASRKESVMQAYSDFFKTLHDETSRTGYLGRGTHYSVLRAVVFHDTMGRPLSEGQFADFAVIWDEDHDTRVMEPIEEIYRRGLLSSFQMFGEHKGAFTAVLSKEVPFADGTPIGVIPFEPVFLTSVDELELSMRSANCLKNDDIVYIGDLVQKTEGEMMRLPTFGRKSLWEIKEVLAQNGLHLGMEVPGWPIDKGLAAELSRVTILQMQINAICQSLNDPWPSQVVGLGSAKNPIISDEDEKVRLYLNNLQMLWRLGTTRPQKIPAPVKVGSRRIVRPQRPVIEADGNLPGWTTDPSEADRDAFQN